MAERRVVVAGGGLAAAKTAEALRAEGFDGAITLVGFALDARRSHRACTRGTWC